ncbi:MAG: nucleotidyltransferase family protein [Anaerolineae bacterium]|nr:nucleotidyltransferase family protein [Anaerolineae bacterium]
MSGVGGALQALGRLLMGAPPDPAADWDSLVALARRHGVSPLLFWRLERERQPGVETSLPEAVRETLRQDFLIAAARAMVAEHQLSRVLGALAAAGVPVMVVKGAAVGAFYPDPALRAYSDLDILVPHTKVNQAEVALLGVDHRCVNPGAWALGHHQHLPPIASGDGKLPVEVHWRLDNVDSSGCLPVGDLWARAQSWSVGGQPALRLDAIDAVLYLCRHAVVQHRARLGLRPLCDLAQMVWGWDQAKWDMLAQRALDYQLDRVVYLVLTLAEQVLGLTVPLKAMEILRPPGEPLPDDLAECLLEPRGEEAVVPVTVVRARTEMTLVARLRHFFWHLFLPRDGMAVAYNIPADSPRIWLAYLRRPFDLLRRYGKSVWDVLWGRRAAWDREVWLERWLRE